MGFFDDLPASEPAPPRRHHPWEPPEAEFPCIVPADTLLLGRTDQVAVAVTGLSAFSAGIEIFVTARIRPSAGHPEEHLPGGPRDLAASRRSFRFGLQFANGGRVTLTGILSMVSPDLAHGFFHESTGMVTFFAAAVMLFALHQALLLPARIAARRKAKLQAVSEQPSAVGKTGPG